MLFVKQLKTHGWGIENNCEDLFQSKYDLFKNAGGDTSNIAFKCKLEYSKRMWTKRGNKKIHKEDVEKAMEKHFQHRKSEIVNNMYI